MRWVVVAALVAACKGKKAPPPPAGDAARAIDAAPTLPVDAPALHDDLRAEARGGAYVVTDADGHVTVELPGKPVLDGKPLEDAGGYHARAVLAKPVEIEVGVLTFEVLPPALLDEMASVPRALADEAKGKLVASEEARVGGARGLRFEITAGERHLFGWYAIAERSKQVVQINCGGDRAACERVAASLQLR